MTTNFSVSEWGGIRIADSSEVPGAITRAQADQLLDVARRASRQLKLGGVEGQRILADGRHELRAAQVVGVIAAREATLEILPKIGTADSHLVRKNLVHMLARTLDLPIADGKVARLSLQGYDLLEILIRLFCDRLFDVLHHGLPRRYVSTEDDLRALRGRLDLIRQFTTLAPAPQKLACRFEELTADIAINRIMKAAVTRLRKIARAPDSQRRLFELEFAFSDVAKVQTNLLPWDQVILDRTNSHWASLLNFVRHLFGDRFQTTSTGAHAGYSLLFEMNTLFEEYIGRTLRATLRIHGRQVGLQRMTSHALIDVEGKGRFATIPDIVVQEQNGEVDWIIDSKWKVLEGVIDDPKLGVAQADVYQMMAYGQVHRCPRVMLLYPHHANTQKDPGRIAEFIVNGTESKLVIATIDLTDIRSVPAQLVRILQLPIQSQFVIAA